MLHWRKNLLLLAVGLLICAPTLAWRSLRPPLSYAALVERGCSGSESCWKKQVLAIAAKDGLQAGFEAVRELYEKHPQFRPDCNHFMGQIAEGLYAQHQDPQTFEFSPDSTLCNYGFYQNYPGDMLLGQSTMRDAQEFCDRAGAQLDAQVPGTSAECYRGIGRALPFIQNGLQGNALKMATAAIADCETLAPSGPRHDQCLSGLFNQLAFAEAQHQYGLSVDVANPSSLCGEVSEQFKAICLGSMKASGVSLLNEGDPLSALQELQKMYGTNPVEASTQIFRKVGYDRAQQSLAQEGGNNENELKFISKMPAGFRASYAGGYALGLTKNSLPGEQHLLMGTFCAQTAYEFPSVDREDCAYQAIAFMRGTYAPEAFTKACEELKNRFQISCEGGNGFSTSTQSSYL